MGIENFKHKDITQGIIGAAMKVHRKLGCGFQEIIYQRCLGIELDNIGIKFIRERKIPIFYENLKVVGLTRLPSTNFVFARIL